MKSQMIIKVVYIQMNTNVCTRFHVHPTVVETFDFEQKSVRLMVLLEENSGEQPSHKHLSSEDNGYCSSEMCSKEKLYGKKHGWPADDLMEEEAAE